LKSIATELTKRGKDVESLGKELDASTLSELAKVVKIHAATIQQAQVLLKRGQILTFTRTRVETLADVKHFIESFAKKLGLDETSTRNLTKLFNRTDGDFFARLTDEQLFKRLSTAFADPAATVLSELLCRATDRVEFVRISHPASTLRSDKGRGGKTSQTILSQD